MKFIANIKTAKKTSLHTMLAVAFALAASFSPGCGGGGGGGGGGGSTGGGGGGAVDSTAPVIAMTYPASAAMVSDVDFATTAFHINFSYTDNASAPAASSIVVSLTMDPGAATEKIKDISSAFTPSSATSSTVTINSSASLYTVLFGQPNPIFLLPSNDKPHTMRINATARDATGNPGFASASFTVYPVAPAPLRIAK